MLELRTLLEMLSTAQTATCDTIWTSMSDSDLNIRYHVYRHFAEHGQAPEYAEIARVVSAPNDEVRAAFHRLHDRHMLFLEPGGDAIRIANPFSAVPTLYRVTAGELAWWANCAWDAFGIAAALNIDARISARYPGNTGTVDLEVANGKVDGKGHLVYFALPFRQWYDDLVYT